MDRENLGRKGIREGVCVRARLRFCVCESGTGSRVYCC